MPSFLVIFIVLFSAIPLNQGISQNSLTVWNIGQGQWVTLSTPALCMHFDMGGEFFPLKKVETLCQHKINIINLSHWDLDHINGLKKITSRKAWLSRFCLNTQPVYEVNPKKSSLYFKLPRCTEKVQQLRYWGVLPKLYQWSPANKQTSNSPLSKKQLSKKERSKKRTTSSNDLSNIFLVSHTLIPGDSPHRTINQHWSSQATQIKRLILSHHGSRTGTSEAMLKNFPYLKQAVASSRWKKYRHPHPEVVYALEKQKVPLLKTEDWGNLHFLTH